MSPRGTSMKHNQLCESIGAWNKILISATPPNPLRVAAESTARRLEAQLAEAMERNRRMERLSQVKLKPVYCTRVTPPRQQMFIAAMQNSMYSLFRRQFLTGSQSDGLKCGRQCYGCKVCLSLSLYEAYIASLVSADFATLYR